MSLESFYYASQIAASFGILVSLAFVIVQLRQNDKSQRTEMQHLQSRRGQDMFMALIDKGKTELVSKAAKGDADLTSEEVLQLNFMMRVLTLNLQDTYWQNKAGLVEDGVLQTAVVGTRQWFSMPGFRICWSLFGPGYPNEIRDLIDRLVVKDVPLTKFRDYGAAWKHAADKLSGAQPS